MARLLVSATVPVQVLVSWRFWSTAPSLVEVSGSATVMLPWTCNVAAPLIVVYLIADAGSVGGGWFSSALIKRGWSVNRARKTAMLTMALLIVPTTLVSRAPTMWTAVLIVGVALAAHQAWSANVYTLASDMFPKSAVGSVVGIGAFGGAMGGVLFQRVTGRVLQANGSDYTPIFVVCGLAYVSAWLIIHLLAPRLEPARLQSESR